MPGNDPDAIEITVEPQRTNEDRYWLQGDTHTTLGQMIQSSVPDEVLSEEYEGEIVTRVKPVKDTPDFIPGFLCEVYV